LRAAMKPVKSSAVRIREARFEDYTQITDVIRRNGLYTKTREEWEHLWAGNPVYKRSSNWAIGWVAQTSDGEIVGYIGNIPLSAEFRGSEVMVACPNSLVMDKSYRGSGYGGVLLRHALEYKLAHIVVATTANAIAGDVLKVFGVSRVPCGDWGRASFWITDYSGFIASVLSKRGWPTALSYAAGPLLEIRDRIRHNDSWIGKNRRDFEVCTHFDERFDRFWEELKRAHPERLLATRSREVLQWHFKHVLEQGKAWIVLEREGSRIISYSVFRRRDVPEHGLNRIQLVDFQTFHDDMQTLTPMLAWALEKCKAEHVHALEAFGFHPDKQAIIDRLAPHQRQLPSWWYFYKPLHGELERALKDAAAWDTSHFDGDASL